MKPLYLRLLAVFCLSFYAYPAQAEKVMNVTQITLTDPTKIKYAMAFDNLVSDYRGKLQKAGCWEAKHDNDGLACPCQFKGEISNIEYTYTMLLKMYPGWDKPNAVLVYPAQPSGQPTVINFSDIHKQMGACKPYHRVK